VHKKQHLEGEICQCRKRTLWEEATKGKVFKKKKYYYPGVGERAALEAVGLERKAVLQYSSANPTSKGEKRVWDKRGRRGSAPNSAGLHR